MRRISLVVFLTCSWGYLALGQSPTTIILTRHAEKLDDGTRDPDLSDEGYQRAASLLKILKDVDVTAVYSTNYKRTKNTVEPLAKEKDLEVQLYDPRDPDFLSSLLEKEEGGKVLISGHSNTVPAMINQLAKTNYPNFSEKEYDNLVFVIIKPENTPTVIWLNFD